jgi:hypothetical protein
LAQSPRCKLRVIAQATERAQNNRTEIAAYQKQYRAENAEKHRQANIEWRLQNRERHCENARRWYRENRTRRIARHRDYQREREKTDLNFKLGRRLRNRLYHALTGKNKVVSAVRDMGCTLDELKAHLEKQFSPAMSWENYGSVWEVDHIKPLANYDLTHRPTCLALIHFSNLQPLLVADNRRKRNKEPSQVG